MHKKCLLFSLVFLGSVFGVSNAFAERRIDAMDRAMAKLAVENASDSSLENIEEFVMNTDPKQALDLDAGGENVNRPLTDREKEKLAAYKKRTKSLNQNAFMSKVNDLIANTDMRLSLSGGYRNDQVTWNIEGVGGYPDIVSELDWDEQEIKYVSFKGDFTFYDHYVLDFFYSTGDIYDGAAQDSDYADSGKQNEYSRSIWETQGGDVYDLMFALGYKMDVEDERLLRMANCDNLVFTGLVGYAINEQDLVGEHGKQVVGTLSAQGTELLANNLHQKYVTEWKGPWFGFELEGRRRKLTGVFRYQYHIADYYSWLSWNLRDDFQQPVSGEHEATGRGFKINVGAKYHMREDFTVDLGMDFQRWHTAPGTNTFHTVASGDIESELNEVIWRSYAFIFGATYYFE